MHCTVTRASPTRCLSFVLAGRPGLATPIRMIWVTAPASFSKARPLNVYMSTWRARWFSQYSERLMREHGFAVIDWLSVTQSRWESSYDGLHYAQTSIHADDFLSQISMMEYMIGLNVMFGECSS